MLNPNTRMETYDLEGRELGQMTLREAQKVGRSKIDKNTGTITIMVDDGWEAMRKLTKRIERQQRNPLTRQETARVIVTARKAERISKGKATPPYEAKYWAGQADALRAVGFGFGKATRPPFVIGGAIRKAATVKRRAETRRGQFNPRIVGRAPLFFATHAAAQKYARSRGWNTRPQYVPFQVARRRV